jgi:hypothetical protein
VLRVAFEALGLVVLAVVLVFRVVNLLVAVLSVTLYLISHLGPLLDSQRCSHGNAEHVLDIGGEGGKREGCMLGLG